MISRFSSTAPDIDMELIAFSSVRMASPEKKLELWLKKVWLSCYALLEQFE
jgi:hypothetical protein